MSLELKQSTVVTVNLGPFVDVTDGVTPETGLATAMDNATTGIRVSKNGAVMIDRNSATVPAHDDDGYYRVALSATDTNTLGTLLIQYEELATCLPMWREYSVITANAWDSKYSTDVLQVDLIEILGGAVPATAVTGIPDVNVTHQGDGAIPAPAVTGVPDVNVTHFVDELAPAPIITGVPDVNAVRILDVAPTLTNNDLDVNIAQVIGTAPSLTGGDIDVNVIGGVAPLGTAMRGTDGVDTATMRGTDSALLAASINLTGGAVDTVTTLTGHTAQTGDSFARIGAAGAGLTDITLNAASINLFWDEAMTETTGAPAVTASFREALKWMFALSRNKFLQTATLATLRNDADGGDLATRVVADDATTYTADEWST